MLPSSTSPGAFVARYHEAVPVNRWVRLLLVVSMIGTAAGAVGIALADDEAARWGGVAALAITAIILLLVTRWFSVMDVTVDEEGVTARYGPFRHRIDRDTIESAEVERYPWLVYAGWGIRFSTRGRRAWSVLFLATGVAITTAGGRRCYISSREPERLHAAIRALLDDRGRGSE